MARVIRWLLCCVRGCHHRHRFWERRADDQLYLVCECGDAILALPTVSGAVADVRRRRP